MQWGVFLRSMSGVLSDGVPLRLALGQVGDSMSDCRIRAKIILMQKRVGSGDPFLDVFVQVSGLSLFRGLSRLGEAADLTRVVTQMADYLEMVQSERSALLSQLRYPGVLLLSVGACFGVVFGMVLPGYLPILTTIQSVLPGPIQWIMRNLDMFKACALGALIVFLGVATAWFLGLWRRENQDMQKGQCCFLMGVLLSNGVSLCGTLDQLCDRSSRSGVSDALWHDFSVSGDWAASFSGVFGLSVHERSVFHYYFSSQSLPVFLSKQSVVYHRRLFQSVRQTVKWGQPLLFCILVSMVFCAVFVAFLPMLYSGYLI